MTPAEHEAIRAMFRAQAEARRRDMLLELRVLRVVVLLLQAMRG